jgi:hypothetical protein
VLQENLSVKRTSMGSLLVSYDSTRAASLRFLPIFVSIAAIVV